MTNDRDKIREMVMALSRGDHTAAGEAIAEVIANKTANIVEGYESRPCDCGSGEDSWWEHDARGIPLCRVCDKCRKEKLSKYRPDVLSDPDYHADEPIEPEEDF